MLNDGLPALLLILVLWGLLQGPDTFTGKPQGPFNDPNTYASVLNLLLLPVLARYLASDLAGQAPWRRTGQLALLAGVAFITFLTASRGAALALLLVLPPLLWVTHEHPEFKRKLALLAAVALVAYLAAFVVSGGLSVAMRLADTLQGGDPPRRMLMQSAWLMIQDHPWLGSGLGTFQLLYPRYRYLPESGTAGGWVHNDYLQLWQEAGLPMLLLILGLAAWVVWAGWQTLRTAAGDAVRSSPHPAATAEALERMGYLAAISAVLLHALVNFLFFFALVSLLVGLYLARLAPPFPKGGRGGDLVGRDDATAKSKSPPAPLWERGEVARSSEHARAIRLAWVGYALILGWLLIGQVAVEGLLGQAQPIQKSLLKLDIAYPRYDVAYWLSVIAPFHPTPQQVMGLELADADLFSGGGHSMREEALSRMDSGMRRAPCYLPYANDALALIVQGPLDAALRAHGQTIVARNLDCNARHGLTYYYAGSLSESDEQAVKWWRAGMAASFHMGDRLLLATAILSRTTPISENELAELAQQMAKALRHMEATSGLRPDQTFWAEAQHKLYYLAGKRYLDLVPPPKP